MKTRVIAGAGLVLALLILGLAAPKWIAAIVFGLMMAIAAYELLYRTGLVKHPRMVIYSCVMAFAVSMWSYFDAVHAYAVLGVLVFTSVLFAEMMADHVKVRFDMLGMCLAAGIVVPYLLTAVIRILSLKLGRYFILIPFVVAFLNDSGAYLVGMRFGKHKMTPVISPNKTAEGALGGILASTLGMLIYGLILSIPVESLSFRVNLVYALLYGFVGAIAGIFGDLCFSVVKRQTGIKDYGNLIPGHGGILDRFDSMMLVAPLMEVLLALIPMAV